MNSDDTQETLPIWDLLSAEAIAWDDVKGGELDLDKVIAARNLEMKFVWDRGIYRYSNTDECWRVSGKGPIGLKWIDTDKGELIRSRLKSGQSDKKRSSPPRLHWKR